MPTVKITTPGVSIELEAGEASITELGKHAMELFREATDINNSIRPGPAFGISIEREPQ